MKDWAFVAEDADAYQNVPPSIEREVRPDIVLVHRPSGGWPAVATRVRFDVPSADAQVAATRRWFRERGVTPFRWLIGPSATPEGIAERVLAGGAERDAEEPTLTAMVLDAEPPGVTGFRVRRVASFADFSRLEAIREAVFGRSGEDGADERLRRTRWAEFTATPGASAFLAEQDGQAVAYGVITPTGPGPMLLAGGVTLPEARGRGAYRALVRARWEHARDAGVPVLVTQAQAASRPILGRLGFRSVGTIEVLVDHR